MLYTFPTDMVAVCFDNNGINRDIAAEQILIVEFCKYSERVLTVEGHVTII